MWSENFDREFVDIFAIQDEIANAIVQALTGKLGMGGEKAIAVELDPSFARAWAGLAAVVELLLSFRAYDELLAGARLSTAMQASR